MKTSPTLSLGLAVIAMLLLSACAIQLAPRYDRVLFDGITQTNTDVMELFASVSSGTHPATFPDREQTYNHLIGSIDALALQSKARPVPETNMTRRVNALLESRGNLPLPTGEAPSAAALEEISRNLVKMRDTDESDGLTPEAFALFKNAVLISMDQVLTYESFLER